MTFPHFFWALIGFLVGAVFLWAYHILKTRGFKFFWYHPIVAGLLLIALLFILESLFTAIEEWQMQADWWIMSFIGVPVALVAGLLLYRGITEKKPSAKG